jgi:hypothetical protein
MEWLFVILVTSLAFVLAVKVVEILINFFIGE